MVERIFNLMKFGKIILIKWTEMAPRSLFSFREYEVCGRS
jgi:hypothetical protein